MVIARPEGVGRVTGAIYARISTLFKVRSCYLVYHVYL